MSAKSAAVCWLTGGIAYVGLEAAAAAAYPGYCYAHDFVSDLGRPDSPLRALVNTAFVVQGTLFLAAAVLLTRGRGSRLFLGSAALNFVGNVIVASVPSGSAGIEWLHVVGAVLAIVGGNAAIGFGSASVSTDRCYRIASLVLAALGLLSVFVLGAIWVLGAMSATATDVVVPGAVWERISVYTIIAWQASSAVLLLSRRQAH